MTVTVLISSYNRGHLLAQSLARMAELTLPAEVIVVDDGGTDDTEAVCRSFEDRLPIRYVFTNHPGHTLCNHARNCGLRLATTEEILISEPELVFVTDIVAQMAEARTIDQSSVFANDITWCSPYRDRDCSFGECGKLSGGHVNLVKREWLLAIGGWDEAIPATHVFDAEIFDRLGLMGHRQIVAPGTEGRHLWHVQNHVDELEGVRYVESRGSDLVANRGVEWGVPRGRDEPPIVSMTWDGA